jgi:hypothetical protein
MRFTRSLPRLLSVSPVVLAAFLGGAGGALLGVCDPFTDVSDPGFCPFVLDRLDRLDRVRQSVLRPL